MQGLEEKSLGWTQVWSPHGPHIEHFSHGLLAGLRAAARGTVEGLGCKRTKLMVRQNKIMCTKTERKDDMRHSDDNKEMQTLRN